MLTVASLIAAFLTLAGLGAVIVNADGDGARLLAAMLTLIVILGCFVLFYRLAVPCEFELTINSERIQFGRVGRASTQRSILRSSVRCVIFDTEDGSLCIDSGGWIATPLAPEVLRYHSQMCLVAEYVKEHWQDVPVVGQMEFQQICQARASKNRKNHRLQRSP